MGEPAGPIAFQLEAEDDLTIGFAKLVLHGLKPFVGKAAGLSRRGA